MRILHGRARHRHDQIVDHPHPARLTEGDPHAVVDDHVSGRDGVSPTADLDVEAGVVTDDHVRLDSRVISRALVEPETGAGMVVDDHIGLDQ